MAAGGAGVQRAGHRLLRGRPPRAGAKRRDFITRAGAKRRDFRTHIFQHVSSRSVSLSCIAAHHSRGVRFRTRAGARRRDFKKRAGARRRDFKTLAVVGTRLANASRCACVALSIILTEMTRTAARAPARRFSPRASVLLLIIIIIIIIPSLLFYLCITMPDRAASASTRRWSLSITVTENSN